MVKNLFCNAFMSKRCVPSKKVLFTRAIAQFGGNNKTRMCFCKKIKYAIQSNLQKCITWPKKSRKGKQGWNKP